MLSLKNLNPPTALQPTASSVRGNDTALYTLTALLKESSLTLV